MMTTDDLGGGGPAPASTPATNDTPAAASPKPVAMGDEVNAVEQQRQDAEKTEAERIEAEKAAKEKPADDKPAKKSTPRDAIAKARASVDQKERAGDTARHENGQFKGKDAPADQQQGKDEAQKPADQQTADKPAAVEQPKAKVPHDEAPKRLDDAAKRDWATAPESVRGAVHRTITELERGITEHQQRWDKLKPYDDLARQNNTSIDEALGRYVAFEQSLRGDLVGGLEGVVRDITGGKFGIRDVAAHIMGQSPDKAQSQSDATVAQLRGQISDLQRQIAGIGGHLRGQVETQVGDEIASFWAENPDAEQLADQMVPHLKSGKTIREAYDLARSNVEELAAKLGFTRPPAPAQTRTATTIPDPAEAQTLERGSKSISGAPSAGAMPATRKPSPSIKAAIQKAIEKAG